MLIKTQWIQSSVTDVFSFFSNETNLEKLTPPWLNFHVLGKSTPQLTTGTLIDYSLKIRGIPVTWQSRIEEWEANRKFVDTQVKGPYAFWHHTHLFEELNGGTLMTDTVRYSLPMGNLGSVLAGNYVSKDLSRIFDYRKKIIEETFK